MGQQASLTLNTVVYDPDGAPNGQVTWTNRSGGILNSFSNVTQMFNTSVGGAKLTKMSYRISVPVVASTDTTCSCTGTLLRTSTAAISFSLAPDASLAERTDLYLRLKDLLASTLVSDAVESLKPAYP